MAGIPPFGGPPALPPPAVGAGADVAPPHGQRPRAPPRQQPQLLVDNVGALPELGLPQAPRQWAPAVDAGDVAGVHPLPAPPFANRPVADLRRLINAPAPATDKPRTFLEFYSDESKDPCQGQYGRIMQRFALDHPNMVDSATLYEQAVNSGSTTHQAYLCCSSTRRGPRIFCVHLPARFPSALDGRVTPWDNNAYAFLGDVTEGVATNVSFPMNAFQPTPPTLVRSEEEITNGFQDLNLDVFPPLPNNHANAGPPLATRYLMYLPSKYAPYFLDSSGYTVKEVWTTLLPLLLQHQDMVNCQPLIWWLRIASQGTNIPNAQGVLGPPVNALPLVAPAADRDLLTHRTVHLKLALPGLGQPAVGLETALLQMASAVVAQTNDQRAARETKAQEALAPILPSTRFQNTLPILMDFLQVHDEMDLPILWHQLANAKKRQEFSVVKELLETFARSTEAFYYLAPVVSNKLVQDLLTFTFAGDSQDDLKTGIQPFMVADGSEEHRRSNLELARTYGMLSGGDHGLLFSDLQALEAKEVRSVPVTYFELEKSFGMFGNLLGVTLGTNHVLTLSYRQFWDLLTRGLRNEVQFLLDNTGRIKPAHLLRSVQLMCYSWFNHRRVRLQPPTINFSDILTSITLHTYITPHLPPALFKLAHPHLTTKTFANPNTYVTTSTAGSSASVSNHDNVSVITAPTLMSGTATVMSGATSRQQTRGSFHSNLTPDSTIQSLIPSNIKLKDLIGLDTPPLMDDGTAICLSYHMRQGCWSNCKRVGSHNKQLTATEKQRLATFALGQMSKRATSTATTVP